MEGLTFGILRYVTGTLQVGSGLFTIVGQYCTYFLFNLQTASMQSFFFPQSQSHTPRAEIKLGKV